MKPEEASEMQHKRGGQATKDHRSYKCPIYVFLLMILSGNKEL
jgi:hypothetical protein